MNRNSNKTLKKKKYKKKTKKQKGGNSNEKNSYILNYIKNIDSENIQKCQNYENIKNENKKYINYCNNTSKNFNGNNLPLCYISNQKNIKGENVYQCNSITQGNDFQKINNFYTGLKQLKYVNDMNTKEIYENQKKNTEIMNQQKRENDNRSFFSILFGLMNKYNPIVLKNQIDHLKQKIEFMENNNKINELQKIQKI